MTIDSTWLRAFKETGPEAFTAARPFKAHCAYVDGQIKLMQGAPSAPQTWDEYIHRQFVRPLERLLSQHEVLVVAFDFYDLVPRAKGMTQLKRRKHIPAALFSETQELPAMVPHGEAWTQCISNRTFKTRVIDLVVLRLPGLLLRGRADRRLIIDYQQPRSYALSESSGRVECESLENLEPMGEADIKFTRYADMFGTLMVDSIDGDSIPIALLHYERTLRMPVRTIPRVSVYRLELKDAPEADEARKRKLEKPEKPERARRTYEYVDIPALYHILVDAIAQGNGRVRLPLHGGHEMGMLTALICLTGTDFSRNLPQISGKTLFELIPRLWMTLAMTYDPTSDLLREDDATDRLVATIYHLKFTNHTSNRMGLATVLHDLAQSKLSARTKQALPTTERVACTVLNANWVLRYWRCRPAECPDPLEADGRFGYTLVGGLPAYASA